MVSKIPSYNWQKQIFFSEIFVERDHSLLILKNDERCLLQVRCKKSSNV